MPAGIVTKNGGIVTKNGGIATSSSSGCSCCGGVCQNSGYYTLIVEGISPCLSNVPSYTGNSGNSAGFSVVSIIQGSMSRSSPKDCLIRFRKRWLASQRLNPIS